MALSTSQTRRAWAAYRCNRKGWLEITFLGRFPVRIIDVCADAWTACETALKATGYTSADIVGSYNCRKIAGRTSGSLHGYRLALDIDPRLNWKHMPWTKTKITRRNVAAVEAIRTNNGQRVFTCGTRFADPMHIQIACRPADLATGIAWGTVKGHQTNEKAPSKPASTSRVSVPDNHQKTLLKINTPHRSATRSLQTALNTRTTAKLTVDGRFGRRTKAAVEAFQKSQRLTVDAIVGPKTWAALVKQ